MWSNQVFLSLVELATSSYNWAPTWEGGLSGQTDDSRRTTTPLQCTHHFNLLLLLPGWCSWGKRRACLLPLVSPASLWTYGEMWMCKAFDKARKKLLWASLYHWRMNLLGIVSACPANNTRTSVELQQVFLILKCIVECFVHVTWFKFTCFCRNMTQSSSRRTWSSIFLLPLLSLPPRCKVRTPS